jgi:hypothetical protein
LCAFVTGTKLRSIVGLTINMDFVVIDRSSLPQLHENPNKLSPVTKGVAPRDLSRGMTVGGGGSIGRFQYIASRTER